MFEHVERCRKCRGASGLAEESPTASCCHPICCQPNLMGTCPAGQKAACVAYLRIDCKIAKRLDSPDRASRVEQGKSFQSAIASPMQTSQQRPGAVACGSSATSSTRQHLRHAAKPAPLSACQQLRAHRPCNMVCSRHAGRVSRFCSLQFLACWHRRWAQPCQRIYVEYGDQPDCPQAWLRCSCVMRNSDASLPIAETHVECLTRSRSVCRPCTRQQRWRRTWRRRRRRPRAAMWCWRSKTWK